MRNIRFAALGALVLLMLLPSPTAGQERKAEPPKEGSGPVQQEMPFGDWFGFSVAWAGDMNRDGVHDWIVGAPRASPKGRREAGQATIFSGRDGSVLRAYLGERPGDHFGWSVNHGGDMDGDGLVDAVVGVPDATPPPGKKSVNVVVLSGRHGDPLLRITEPGAGTYVAFAGDTNGDRRSEIAVVANDAVILFDSSGSRVEPTSRAYDEISWYPAFKFAWGVPERDGRVRYFAYTELLGTTRLWALAKEKPTASMRLGKGGTAESVSLTVLPDEDADSVPELLLDRCGSIESALPGHRGDKEHEVLVYSGATAKFLSRLSFPSLLRDHASLGDMDGDGVCDIGVIHSTGNHEAILDVLSRRTGKSVRTTTFPNSHRAVLRTCGLPDLNGDGVPEVLIGAYRPERASAPENGKVRVFSGKDLKVLFEVENPKK